MRRILRIRRLCTLATVSYTHLDVYKRQLERRPDGPQALWVAEMGFVVQRPQHEVFVQLSVAVVVLRVQALGRIRMDRRVGVIAVLGLLLRPLSLIHI